MSPADTLALSADKLSQLLRDTIRERVLAAQAGEQMRSDVLGQDVQAICDVIAYEADVIASAHPHPADLRDLEPTGQDRT